MQPWAAKAAVCRLSRNIHGMDLGPFSQVDVGVQLKIGPHDGAGCLSVSSPNHRSRPQLSYPWAAALRRVDAPRREALGRSAVARPALVDTTQFQRGEH